MPVQHDSNLKLTVKTAVAAVLCGQCFSWLAKAPPPVARGAGGECKLALPFPPAHCHLICHPARKGPPPQTPARAASASSCHACACVCTTHARITCTHHLMIGCMQSNRTADLQHALQHTNLITVSTVVGICPPGAGEELMHQSLGLFCLWCEQR